MGFKSARAAPLNEQPREFEEARVACGARKLGERHLHLRVTAHGNPAVGPKLAVQLARDATRNLHQAVVVPGPQARDGGLEEVAEAVHLVTPLEVAEARALSRVAKTRVEVAVRVLRGGDPVNERVVRGGKRGVAGAAKLPRHRLEQLVDLGVHELDAVVRLRRRRSRSRRSC